MHPEHYCHLPDVCLVQGKFLFNQNFLVPQKMLHKDKWTVLCVCVGGGVPHDCFISNFSNSIMRALLVFQSQSKEAAILSLEPYLLNLHYFYSN